MENHKQHDIYVQLVNGPLHHNNYTRVLYEFMSIPDKVWCTTTLKVSSHSYSNGIDHWSIKGLRPPPPLISKPVIELERHHPLLNVYRSGTRVVIWVYLEVTHYYCSRFLTVDIVPKTTVGEMTSEP